MNEIRNLINDNAANPPNFRKWVIALVAAGVLLRIIAIFSDLQVSGGDTNRFLYQARNLVAGNGFLEYAATNIEDGVLQGSIRTPPGYPVFIASVFAFFGDRIILVIGIQVFLSVASCYLLYATLAPHNSALALFGLGILSLTPVVAAYSVKLLSEAFGLFLSCVFVFIVSQFVRGKRNFAVGTALGGLCVSLILTVPGTIFVSGLPCLAILVGNYRKYWLSLGIVTGGLAIMVPWQIHCYRSVGRIVPTILTLKNNNENYTFWLRTWMRHASDWNTSSDNLWWDLPGAQMRSMPAYAFTSEEERYFLEEQARNWRDCNAPAEVREPVFKILGMERKKRDPIGVYLLNPLRRSVFMWTDLPETRWTGPIHIRHIFSFGFWQDTQINSLKHTIRLLLQSLASFYAYIVHFATLFAFACFVYRAIRKKSLLALSIVVGLLIFTFLNAFGSIIELRRNIPLIPFFFAIGFLTLPLPIVNPYGDDVDSHE
jgi:hypothetical protein